jgi:hypothetical protein
LNKKIIFYQREKWENLEDFTKEAAPFGDKEAASIGVIRKGFSPEVEYSVL